MTETIAIYLSEREIAIQSHRQAIKQAETQLLEIEATKTDCRERIAQITQKLLEIGSRSELRLQQVEALRQQHDLLSSRYQRSRAYSDLMNTTEVSEQSTSDTLDAQKAMLEALRLYRRVQADSDREEANDSLQRESLEHEHSQLVETLSSSDMRAIALQQAQDYARASLGELLYAESRERIERHQDDLKSKISQEKEARQSLQQAITQELSKLASYPALQQEAKSLIPYEDEITQIIEATIILLKKFLMSSDTNFPQLQSRTGQETISALLSANQLEIESMVLQALAGEKKPIQMALNDLEYFLQQYKQEKQ